jgi:ABC-type amino acid transport substrate-binding protein/mono/diheme cytochrome c family protein
VVRVAPVLVAALLLSASLSTHSAQAGPALRVCADPENPPFTSADPREKGMYLELAERIAARLGTAMEPVFFPTGPGQRTLRPTLLAGRCDAFFGMPYTREAATGRAIALTRPFQELGYAVLARRPFTFERLEDLDGRTVGVEFGSTAQTLLSVRERVRLATFRTTEEAVAAIARGDLDTAVLWGPVAGYFAARHGLLEQLAVVSVRGYGLRGQAAIAVRASDQALRERLDRAVQDLAPDIRALAAKYHFPLDPPLDLEAMARPVLPAADVPDPGRPAAETPPTETPSADRTAPPPGLAVNPYSGDPAAITSGRTQFNVHCSHCHSPNAQSPDPVRDLRRLHSRYGDRVNDVFYATVTRGRATRGMPPWGQVLDEETIWRIKAFLESVQQKPEP